MITIELGNIYSKVVGGTAKSIRDIDSALAVEVEGHSFTESYRMGMWDGYKHFFSVQTRKFPTGLISEVCAAIRGKEKYCIKDLRGFTDIEVEIPDSISLLDDKLGSIALRDYQVECVQDALTLTRGVINVATNGGKTEIACAIMKILLECLPEGMVINFFTHSKEIFVQSKARIEKRLGIEVGQVGMDKWDIKKINVIMIPTISKYLKKPTGLPNTKKYKDLKKPVDKFLEEMCFVGRTDQQIQRDDLELERLRAPLKAYEKEEWDKINAKVKRANDLLKSTFCFIGDEAHHSSSDTWYNTFMKLTSCLYRYALTGTIDNEDPINTKRLHGCTGPIIAKISNQFLIEEGYSAKPTINMMEIDCPLMEGLVYEEARKQGIVYNEIRNIIFAEKIIHRAKNGKHCLVIVNETEHGDIILEMLEDAGIDARFAHGGKSTKFRAEALSDLREGKLRVLVATSILDEGVDVSGINCLFLMAGGKSMRMLLQRIGRGLRKKDDGSGLEVYDALDFHNEYLVEHTLDRYKVYKEEGFDVIK